LLLRRELARLHERIGGLRNMTHVPDILFVVDIQRESLGVDEANKLTVPVVAMVDTNCDPDRIDYPIPSNDDAIRAIKLMTGKMADAVLEGQELRTVDEADRAASQPSAYEPEPVGALDEEKPQPSGLEFSEEQEQDVYLGPSILARLAEGLDESENESK
jgi:small subunit ribosomal protein S2